MQEARVRYALLVICLICLGGSGYLLLSGGSASTPPVSKPIVITPPPTDTPVRTQKRGAMSNTAFLTSSHPPTRIYVDVTGAVRRPSLYVLKPESRVMQAILAAGGPADNADIEAVNLAQKISDGEKVFVPVRTPPSLPAFQNVSAPSTVASSLSVSPNSASGMGAKSTHSSHSNKIGAGSAEQIGLNSASAEQLQRLPGVGPSMAARILAYRQQAGGFSKIEDLMMITGIGPKKFAKIKSMVTLNMITPEFGIEVLERSLD